MLCPSSICLGGQLNSYYTNISIGCFALGGILAKPRSQVDVFPSPHPRYKHAFIFCRAEGSFSISHLPSICIEFLPWLLWTDVDSFHPKVLLTSAHPSLSYIRTTAIVRRCFPKHVACPQKHGWSSASELGAAEGGKAPTLKGDYGIGHFYNGCGMIDCNGWCPINSYKSRDRGMVHM